MQLTELRVDARPIAIVRIGLGLAVLLNTLEAYFFLEQIALGKIALPIFQFLPSPTTAGIQIYLMLAVTAAVAIILGWHTATAATISTVLSTTVLLWDQQTYSSHRVLVTLLLAYLIFARSDSAWALAPRRASVPWWPQLLMMTQLSVCYFFAAASKVNLQFLSGKPLSQWVHVQLPLPFFTSMAVGTVIVEFTLAFALWFPSTRRFAIVLGILLHVSIVGLLADQTVPLFSFAVTCLSLYGLFLVRPSPVLVSDFPTSEDA